MSSHNRKTVLFLTVSEAGQSNSILALALELLTHPNIDAHVASFPILRKRAEQLSSTAKVVESRHPGSSFTFHDIDGMSLGESIWSKGLTGESIPHPPLAKSRERGMKNLMHMLAGWSGKEYVRIVDSCKNIINAVNPNIVVVDSFFGAGCEACWSLSKRYIVNCPMAPLDVARPLQPMWKNFFYYPFFGSGIAFPIPWSYVLKNVTLNLAFMWRVLIDPDVKELTNYRNEHGLPGRLPMGDLSIVRCVHAFCFGLPELDLPLILPPKVGLYGPVTLDSIPLSRGDELSEWLDGGRTIVMCMGSHFHYSEAQVRSITRAFRAGTSPTDQVLWKIRNMAKFQHILDEELENERVKERFRIVEWIDVDPGEVIRHENVVAYVHHGGANSYFEAARAGVPQIILAQWFDLYDMAVRAEYVGIGIYGNQSVAPDIDAVELGAAISRLLSPGEEAERFARRAREIGELCRAAPGKKGVATKILELAEDDSVHA